MEFKTHNSSSAGNLYAVSSGNSTLLIEAGLRLPAIRKALDFKLSSVSGCLCTHFHLDHAKGCKDLLKSGIDVYVTAETAQALKLAGPWLHIIEPLKEFKIGTWSILPFPTVHDTPGSVGYLIEEGGGKLLFLTDTQYCPYKLNGLNIIAVEANWSASTLAPDLDPVVKQRLYKSHMSLERVLRFLDANDLSAVREIHLIHLSGSNSSAELFKETVAKATGIQTYIAAQ